MTLVLWAFANEFVPVRMLGERVAYTWTCSERDHVHRIQCLWVWHKCTMELHPGRTTAAYRSDKSFGWKPTGVGAHSLISVDPLHIEASVYWPDCCGLHGWIRDGQWTDA